MFRKTLGSDCVQFNGKDYSTFQISTKTNILKEVEKKTGICNNLPFDIAAKNPRTKGLQY